MILTLVTVLPWLSVASFLFVFLAKIHALPLDQIATCQKTEICFLQANQLPEINCNCTPSTQCSWSRFADRGETLSNGTTESVLMWQRTGYGQYICVRDGSQSMEARNIMILPQSEEIKTLIVWHIHWLNVWWGRGSIILLLLLLQKERAEF